MQMSSDTPAATMLESILSQFLPPSGMGWSYDQPDQPHTVIYVYNNLGQQKSCQDGAGSKVKL